MADLNDFKIHPEELSDEALKKLSDEALLEKLLKVREQTTNLYFRAKLLKLIPEAQVSLFLRCPNIDMEDILEKSMEEIGEWEEAENILKAKFLERRGEEMVQK